MRVRSLCFAVSVLGLSVAGNSGGDSPEYYSLGCPSSTEPRASQKQQLDAITDYGNLLYHQKQIDSAENTYVAKQFINHAPEVPGNGTDLAIKTLKPMLATSTIEIQRVFVGSSADGTDYSVTYFKGISSVRGVGVIADIWRMIGTCLVEHWDVAAGVQNSSNPIAYF
ncbi:MAG: hypothetical protein Q9195_004541 [Heterodermia aff. obscurata]